MSLKARNKLTTCRNFDTAKLIGYTQVFNSYKVSLIRDKQYYFYRTTDGQLPIMLPATHIILGSAILLSGFDT